MSGLPTLENFITPDFSVIPGVPKIGQDQNMGLGGWQNAIYLDLRMRSRQGRKKIKGQGMI